MSRPRAATALRCLAVLLFVLSGVASGYPLDGEAESGIRRLAGYRDAPGNPPGALLRTADIHLHLLDQPRLEFDRLPPDAALQAALSALFAERDPSYALVVVDFADPGALRWAALNPDLRQNVGSVSKIVTALALFAALAEVFPDVHERARVLREAQLRAGDWVVGDHHEVPRFDPDTGTNSFAVLHPDDVFALSEWVDHALSLSANGAGSVIWREAMLVKHFGTAYPLSWSDTEAFFRTTPKAQLAQLAREVTLAPLLAAGLNPDALMQGSFWTENGKRHVPGGMSYATPRELTRYMLRMEQGRLVDAWTSLEIKKYLYVTKRRYRYIYPPELRTSAVYFKSGSLYKCAPEEGFHCGKYMGNVRNLMNSVTTVETLSGDPAPRRYVTTLLSNVLRINSAWDHARIGAAIHEMVRTRAPVELREAATRSELDAVGRSD